MHPEAEQLASVETVMDADFRARRREHRLWEYEQLTGADNWHERRRRLAEAIVAGNWRWKNRPGVTLSPPIDWTGLCAGSRSWNLALHSWEPLAAPLSAYEHIGSRDSFDFALGVAIDWLEQPCSTDGDAPFAWYDLAVGTRAYRLAYLLDVAAREPTVAAIPAVVLNRTARH